jgi:hypothetical protein
VEVAADVVGGHDHDVDSGAALVEGHALDHGPEFMQIPAALALDGACCYASDEVTLKGDEDREG